MRHKTNTSVELTRAALKKGQTVALVGYTGIDITDYIAGLSDEERSRLKVVEMSDAFPINHEVVVPNELLGLQQVDVERWRNENHR